ncbi:MAG: site-specific integrase, partial [Anaerolineae bacterium]|nr:site-specific integrase [Anaerolineae bacterium]
MSETQSVRWERYPLVAQVEYARRWLTIQANLGRAPNTVDAYGRALQDYLAFCHQQRVELVAATREHIALYVRDLATRANPRAATARTPDGPVGLANATLQQRLTAIRLLYDFLVEEGVRPDNPVGRGQYSPHASFGGARSRAL